MTIVKEVNKKKFLFTTLNPKIKNMYNDEDKKMWAYKGECDNIIRFQQRDRVFHFYIYF